MTGDLRDAFLDNFPFGDNAAQERRRCSGAWTAPARAARPWRYCRWCGACARPVGANVAVCIDHWTHACVLRATQRGQARQGLGGCQGAIGRLHRLAALGRRCRPALGSACVRAPAPAKLEQKCQQWRWLEKGCCKEERSKEERNQESRGKKSGDQEVSKKDRCEKGHADQARHEKKRRPQAPPPERLHRPRSQGRRARKLQQRAARAEKKGATKKAPSKRTAAKKSTSTAAKKHAAKSAPWNTSSPKAASRSKPLSPSQKTQARKRAKAAGRPYPNLVDNMAVASKRSATKRATKSSGTKKPAGKK